MLCIDDRESDNIAEEVARLGVEVSVTRLEYGDLCFLGNGPDGRDVMIGAERKRLSDLINSMQKRRLAGHQLRGMRKAYDVCFLFAEGLWRPGKAGEIEHYAWDRRARKNAWQPLFANVDGRAVSYAQLTAFLTTVELKGGVVVRRTGSVRETASQYASLYRWWTEKTWSEHHSLEQIYCGDLPVKGHGSRWALPHAHSATYTGSNGTGRTGTVSATLDTPSTLWRMASQLPGVDSRAREVAGYFGTVRDMALAGLDPGLRAMVERWYDQHPGSAERAWRELDGFGEARSKAVVRAITERGA